VLIYNADETKAHVQCYGLPGTNHGEILSEA
jgi:hypothetical protein